jgi:hypothetical protein
MATVEASGCASTVYVNASRPDDFGDGLSWATAKKTIQAAVDIVCEGGTINVAAGVYEGHIYVDISCQLIGAGALTTIIDGEGWGQALCISGDPGQTNTVSGFTLQNGHIGEPPPAGNVPLQLGGPGMPVGGGMYVAYANVVVVNDCTIRNNIADFLGGGVYNAGQITLNRCTVSGNSAALVGGGIANMPDLPKKLAVGELDLIATMTLVNCTVSGNSVTQATQNFAMGAEYIGFAMDPSGGGLLNAGIASFTNVTIAGNSVPALASAHGGGFSNIPLQCGNHDGDPYAPVATFKNTLVASNVPDNGYNNGGTVTSYGYNLDSQSTCGFYQATDQRNANPLLGPLQNNGGPTSTCAITAESPACDRGTSVGAPATDQRGIIRPQSIAYDIGAFELVYVAPPPVNPLIGPGSGSSPVGNNPSNTYTPPVLIPTLAVQSASLSSYIVTPGTPVTVTADIANRSAVNGNKKITLYVNGQIETTQGVTVNSGGSSKLAFDVSRSEPGDYTVYVDGVPAGSFKVELFRESDGILIFSAGLVALAFLIGIIMLWRRQRAV